MTAKTLVRRGGAVVAVSALVTLGFVGNRAEGVALPPPHATPGEMILLAGGSLGPGLGDGGRATAAQLSYPDGLAVDTNGDVFVADSGDNMVREITASGLIVALAGTGIPGYYGDGGPAYNAELDDPTGLALDSSGDLFIADSGNNAVREVADATTDGSDGTITTYAGNGLVGYSGDGGAPSAAELDDPTGVAVGPDGQVAIADTGNSVVREVVEVRIVFRPDKARRSPSIISPFRSEIETVAGVGSPSEDFGDGGPATDAGLDFPSAIAFDPHGNLYVADTGNSAIREVNASTGDISGFAHVPYPTGLGLSPSGRVDVADPIQNEVVAAQPGGKVVRIAGTGAAGDSGDGKAATAAELESPEAVALDSYGDVFVSDTGNDLVREVVVARAPMFTTASPALVVAARSTYRARFTAVGVAEPTYALSHAPSWLKISSSTGAVKGNPAIGPQEILLLRGGIQRGGIDHDRTVRRRRPCRPGLRRFQRDRDLCPSFRNRAGPVGSGLGR